MELIVFGGILLFWLVLQVWILPKAGMKS